MEKSAIRYVLINTPLTDPTAPYHSISYLVGSSSNAGYTNFSCLDANIEMLNYLAREEQVVALLRHCEDIRAQLEEKRVLTRGEQRLYSYALQAVGFTSKVVRQAIEVMRNPQTFYDYNIYCKAVDVLNRWMNILSVQGFPGQFERLMLNLNVCINFANVSDLTNPSYLERIINPFLPYFNGPFTETLLSSHWDLIGLSVNYVSQLPFAVFMCRLIKALCPNCILCLGGTEISDDIKYLCNPDHIWKLLPDCDAIVVGEGETALIDLLDSIFQEKPLPKQRPGILLQGEGLALKESSVRYEDLSTLADARYDIWNWDHYWSPEPVALYSPTRGCYWNKCTFCDYGLNTNLPTSPSRVRPIPAAIREIQNITHIARTLYFSVDAISPSYLRKITQAIQNHHLSIRWSAELRLEQTLRKELGAELKKAGCVAISFGYESGSQRILNLINKGVNLSLVPEVLQELARVGIGAQMMGFIGFPGETAEEAYATYEFLCQYKEYWTLAGIGDFVLTPGSIVAKRYQDFGIQRVGVYDGDDIARELFWVDENGQTRHSGDMRNDTISCLAQSLIKPFKHSRPFAGGIDSNHSILYFAKYGPSLVPPEALNQKTWQPFLETAYYRTPLKNVGEFLEKADFRNYYTQQRAQSCTPNAKQVLDWLSEYSEEQEAPDGNHEEVVEIYPSGHFITWTQQIMEAEFRSNPAYKKCKELLLRSGGVL